MLKTIRLASLMAVLLPGLAFASAEKSQLIDEIIDKSGMEASLESLPAQFQAQAMQQKPYTKEPEAVEELMQILSNSADMQTMQATMAQTFNNKMSLAELKEVKTWLDSDLGSQIAKAEAEASNPANMQDIQMFAASFQTQPPSQEKIAAVQNFVEKSKLVESAMNMVEQIIGSTVNSLEQFNEQPDPNKAEQVVTQAKAMMEPMLWQQMILMSHYTYQNFSVEEINQYTQYLTTNTGKKYLETGIEGITAVITQIMETASPQIKQAAEAHKKG